MGTRLRKDSSIPHIHGRGDGNDLNINHTSFQDNRFADEDNEGVLTKIAPRAKRGPSGPMSSHNLNKQKRSMSSNPYNKGNRPRKGPSLGQPRSRNYSIDSKSFTTVVNQPGESTKIGAGSNCLINNTAHSVMKVRGPNNNRVNIDQSYGLNPASISNLHDQTNQEYLLKVQMSYRNKARNKISTQMKGKGSISQKPTFKTIQKKESLQPEPDEYTVGSQYTNPSASGLVSRKIRLPQKTPSKRSIDNIMNNYSKQSSIADETKKGPGNMFGKRNNPVVSKGGSKMNFSCKTIQRLISNQFIVKKGTSFNSSNFPLEIPNEKSSSLADEKVYFLGKKRSLKSEVMEIERRNISIVPQMIEQFRFLKVSFPS